MGWFTTTIAPPSPPPPKISADGTPIAPDRTQRAKCWAGRDSFFECLDTHSIIDSTSKTGAAEAAKECSKELQQFEGACASSWVTYFKKRRVMEYQKTETLERLKKEGAIKMPGELAPPRKEEGK